MQVRDLMTVNPYGIQATDSIQHTAELMRRHGVGAIVVYDQHVPVGLITDRDIAVECIAAGHHAADCHAREHMTADPVSVSGDMSAEDALQRMAAEQVRRLLVVDEGAVTGILALGDLAAAVGDAEAIASTLREISLPIRTPVRV